ncbi:MAG: class I SAM-dependent methyltransferase [Lachnospiraceae bacterium]|nr:class I SAM-dependent methyltransferase [Lachnospiraceae bacterium]
MNYLEQYYSDYDEEGRLLSQHGQVEYLTTMKYIQEYLAGDKSKRILEVGAGTGRYSVTLAKEGYQIDAVELTEHNLSLLRAKLNGSERINTYQGNALELSMFTDNTFDLTLVLGPMYHLYTKEDKELALKEAIRVTKQGGIIMVAYCMNEATLIKYVFAYGNLQKCLEHNKISESFRCISQPADLFESVRIEEIYDLTKDLPVSREKIIATDGATNYMREVIDSMDKENFAYWLKYHLYICERQDLIGATNHSLDILRKKGRIYENTCY